jgi:hypothetical protein
VNKKTGLAMANPVLIEEMMKKLPTPKGHFFSIGGFIDIWSTPY